MRKKAKIFVNMVLTEYVILLTEIARFWLLWERENLGPVVRYGESLERTKMPPFAQDRASKWNVYGLVENSR